MERNSMRRARNPDKDESVNAFVRNNDEYDINDYTMRLLRLSQNEGLPDVFSVPIQSGPVVGRFTTTDYTPVLNEKDTSRLMLMGMYPVTDNMQVGSRMMTQQDGSTMLRPALSATYGPFQASAGYQGVIPADRRAPTTFVPNYSLNINAPVGDGFLAGGVDKTAGQRDPFMFASYERPFMGGSLGLDASADTRLRNMAIMLGYRRAF
jgi:hypothetical protein